jgi:hypothetical protein
MSHDGITVIVVVMYGRHQYPHFVSGSSASIDSLANAYIKAYQEAELTLVSFKANGIKPMSRDELLRPLDHGYLYALQENWENVDFLRTGFSRVPEEPTMTIDSLIGLYNPTVVNLSNENYKTIQVVRVFSEALIPANFGFGVEHFTHNSLPESVCQQRVSELEPHYLA